MKLAIQGHPTRGKEVIQILESLGGKNASNYNGKDNCVYYISTIHNCICRTSLLFSKDKYYTLEKFEKEFPFKVGDKVKYITSIAIIKGYCYINNEPAYKVESMELGIVATIPTKLFEPYKEMEIRNITLTLEKAKEWYNSGGELKEVALQAFTEKELTKVDLPKTWEEFCNNFPLKNEECYVGTCCGITMMSECVEGRDIEMDKNVCPSRKSAEAHLALIQLEQLRDCWRQGWEPTPHQTVFAIKFAINGLGVYQYCSREFLSFPTREMAEEFLNCFRDLIEKARNLI